MTKEKLHFNEDLKLHVPPEQLWKDFQGELDFEYDHATYWPALNKLCEEKRAERKERWVKGGKIYGESEIYLKGGNAPSLGQPVSQEAEKVAETPVVAAPPLAEEKKENVLVEQEPTILANIPEGSEGKAIEAKA